MLAGGSPKAILYRIESEKKVSVLHDFAGNELRSITQRNSGTVYVAVNKFKMKTSGMPRYDQDGMDSGGTKPKNKTNKSADKEKFSSHGIAARGEDRGRGRSIAWISMGGVSQLHSLAKGYFTGLAVDASGRLWAGEGTLGKAFMVDTEDRVFTAIDVDERQILSIAAVGTQLFFGTGDSGAISSRGQTDQDTELPQQGYRR